MNVAEILDAYIRALEAGEAPDRAALVARHPAVAEELKAALDGLDFVRRAAHALADGPDVGHAGTGKALGDYRLLREVGRGGMAVVYEAEQVSLGRRVALKVLPFAAVLDPRHLQRFKNEALAAAHLRHPHIVPVYAVGCERGVHYYAMQFVDGQTLSMAIHGLRNGGTGEGKRTPISSHGSNRTHSYVRMAATLGVQAAGALDHAHQLGIVHRDVKPANLLVDETGALWVTDFGLACSVADVGLTMTGEILGTIRYMSPEQALGKRAPIDHRTDVYSLGATLYELFTLEPAFPGDDPHLVIQDIARRDPVPPRKLNPALAVDLETVLLKAMAKDPATRYATAQELADDLTRFLDDKPVLARRPSAATRVARWGRRHRGLVAALFAFLLLAVAALVADNIRVTGEQRRTAAALARARENQVLARGAVDKFLVEAGVADLREAPMPPRAQWELLEAALTFYESYMDDVASLRTRTNVLHRLHRYAEALLLFDRILGLRPRDAGALAGRGHMLWHLRRHAAALAALDEAIAVEPGRAEAHGFRGSVLHDLGRFGEALEAHDRACAIEPDRAGHCANRGNALIALGRFADALVAFDRALALDPTHAYAHMGRGNALGSLQRPEEALAAHRVAVRFGPRFPETHYNLGNALLAAQDTDGAMREYREAIRIDADYAPAHSNLAFLLWRRGDRDDAIREYREAVRASPDFAEGHCNLGNTLLRQGLYKEALASLRKGHELGSQRPGWNAPSKRWVEHAELMAEIEGRLDRVLAGEAVPRDAAERIEFAEMLYMKARYAEAAGMYVEAFAGDPAVAEDMVGNNRSNAVYAAALAAAREGADAARWRGEALAWLRADLAAREKTSKDLVEMLDSWKRDPELAAVRDRLDHLSAEERAAWAALWADIDKALARARASK